MINRLMTETINEIHLTWVKVFSVSTQKKRPEIQVAFYHK